MTERISTLERILNEPTPYETLYDIVQDAKHKLDVACDHDATCARVRDLLLAEARAGTVCSQLDYYTILALELLRRSVHLQRQTLKMAAMQINPPVITWPTCPKPHYEARTWWQRLCLKLGGFK